MMRRSFRLTLSALSVGMLLLGACAPAAPASPAGGAQAGSSGAAPANTGVREFKMGYGSSAGFSHVALMTAVEALNQKGYKIENVFFAQGEIGLQAAQSGEVAFQNGTTSDLLNSVQKGSNLKIISDRNANEWTIYSAGSIQKCDDLNGKKLAVHSTAAVSTAMTLDYLKTTCPNAKPNQLIIAGSDNRAAALIAGQIDATPLELADGIALDKKSPGKFRRLVDFAHGLPNLDTSALYVNGDFLAKNPQVVRDMLREQLNAHRRFADDPAFFKQQVTKFLPEFDKSNLDDIIKGYKEISGFDLNGGITPEKLDYTIKFFTDAGTIKPGLKASDVADFAPLNDVLKEIGKK